jgi:hypothetical protein
MGRKATGRLAHTTSVSLRAEDAAFLDEHNLSATDCIRRWIDQQRDQGEAAILLAAIQKLESELADKKRRYVLAIEREERVRKREELIHGSR